MKVLEFRHRDTYYVVSLEQDTYGHVVQYGDMLFSLPHPSWRIAGFSHHHMNNRPTRTLKEVEEDPSLAVKCLVWDVDHGTIRCWGGMYAGKIPRVTSAYVRKNWEPNDSGQVNKVFGSNGILVRRT